MAEWVLRATRGYSLRATRGYSGLLVGTPSGLLVGTPSGVLVGTPGYSWVLPPGYSGETDWRWLAAIDSLAAVPIPFCGTKRTQGSADERPLTDGGAERSQPTQRTTQPSNKQTNKQTNKAAALSARSIGLNALHTTTRHVQQVRNGVDHAMDPETAACCDNTPTAAVQVAGQMNA